MEPDTRQHRYHRQIEELNGKIRELVTFFLIFYEMGLEDRDVRRIMGITQEAPHTLLTNGKGLQNAKIIISSYLY